MVPSETTTVWAPAGRVGIVKVTVAEPLAEVVPPAVIVAAVAADRHGQRMRGDKARRGDRHPGRPVRPTRRRQTGRRRTDSEVRAGGRAVGAVGDHDRLRAVVVAGTVKVTVEEPVAAVVHRR